MERYLIDNNVISHFLAGMYTDAGMNFIASVFNDVPNISVITEIEALSWIHTDKTKEAIIKSFVKDANTISINSKVVEICVSLRRSRKIKTPDAIIAATAIALDMTLISSDAVFENIDGLKLLKPSHL